MRVHVTREAFDKKDFSGFFIADVAEVRPGLLSYNFRSMISKLPSLEETRCFSVIASEWCYDLMADTPHQRDFLVEGLRYLASTHIDRMSKKKPKMSRPDPRTSSMYDYEIPISGSQARANGEDWLRNELNKLVRVRKHNAKGKIELRKLFLKGDRLFLSRTKSGASKGIDLSDVCEVRSGANSFNFMHTVQDDVTSFRCMAVIGSERVLAFELPSMAVRDNMVTLVRSLLEIARPDHFEIKPDED